MATVRALVIRKTVLLHESGHLPLPFSDPSSQCRNPFASAACAKGRIPAVPIVTRHSVGDTMGMRRYGRLPHANRRTHNREASQDND